MQFSDIEYKKDGRIATITLNRPEVLNALSPTMIDEWVAAIESAKHDDDVRVLVVTGAGRGFCSGADVKALATTPDSLLIDRRDQMRKGIQRIPRALESFDKPYIASINGPATGAGFDAATMADIRIASDRARFAINHLRVARLSADGGYYFLTRILGVARTLELVMTSRSSSSLINAGESLVAIFALLSFLFSVTRVMGRFSYSSYIDAAKGTFVPGLSWKVVAIAL